MQKFKSLLACLIILFFFSTAHAAQSSFLSSVYLLLLGGGPPANANTLIIDKKGAGGGKVTSSVPGIDCGSDCWEVYDDNAIVVLSAYSDGDSYFWGWGGGVCVGTTPCTVTMNQALTVEATFQTNQSNEKMLDIVISGQGRVYSDDGLISCNETSSNCQKSYPTDTPVTLNQDANGDTTFTRWEINGAPSTTCNDSGPCEITMTESTTVTAVFTPPYPMEKENNNSILEANDITATIDTSEGIGGLVESRGVSDYFKIEVDEAKTITVHLSSTYANIEADKRLVLQLQDSAGNLMTQFIVRPSILPPDAPPVYEAAPFNIDLPGKGIYYLVVMGTGYDNTQDLGPGYFYLQYNLKIESNDTAPQTPDPAEKEGANNLRTTANTLNYDTTMHASLMSLEDEDWFITGSSSEPHGSTLVFNTSEPGTDGDPTEPKKNWMVTAYKVGSDVELLKGSVQDGSSFHLPPSTTGYHFVVTDFRGAGQPGVKYNGAPYTLKVLKNSDDTAPVAELENNLSTANGVIFDINSNHAGFSGQSQLVLQDNSGVWISENDPDRFIVKSSAGGTFNFTFNAPDGGNAEWYVTSSILPGCNVNTPNTCWKASDEDESGAVTLVAGTDYVFTVIATGFVDASSASYTITAQ